MGIWIRYGQEVPPPPGNLQNALWYCQPRAGMTTSMLCSKMWWDMCIYPNPLGTNTEAPTGAEGGSGHRLEEGSGEGDKAGPCEPGEGEQVIKIPF